MRGFRLKQFELDLMERTFWCQSTSFLSSGPSRSIWPSSRVTGRCCRCSWTLCAARRSNRRSSTSASPTGAPCRSAWSSWPKFLVHGQVVFFTNLENDSMGSFSCHFLRLCHKWFTRIKFQFSYDKWGWSFFLILLCCVSQLLFNFF